METKRDDVKIRKKGPAAPESEKGQDKRKKENRVPEEIRKGAAEVRNGKTEAAVTQTFQTFQTEQETGTILRKSPGNTEKSSENREGNPESPHEAAAAEGVKSAFRSASQRRERSGRVKSASGTFYEKRHARDVLKSGGKQEDSGEPQKTTIRKTSEKETAGTVIRKSTSGNNSPGTGMKLVSGGTKVMKVSREAAEGTLKGTMRNSEDIAKMAGGSPQERLLAVAKQNTILTARKLVKLPVTVVKATVNTLLTLVAGAWAPLIFFLLFLAGVFLLLLLAGLFIFLLLGLYNGGFLDGLM